VSAGPGKRGTPCKNKPKRQRGGNDGDLGREVQGKTRNGKKGGKTEKLRPEIKKNKQKLKGRPAGVKDAKKDRGEKRTKRYASELNTS